jgi:putative sterol carrier protein
MAISNVKDVFGGMPAAFNPAAAKGVNAIFQFEITGDGGGSWNVNVKDGACQVQEGKNATPTVTLTMASDTWLGIVNKQVNAIQAFMGGKLKLTGNMMLAQKIQDLFKF